MKAKLNTIYIISKGRPECVTARTLTKMNYPGEWFIVCGTNDTTIPEYQAKWGEDRILIFDWYEEVKESDLLDNFGVATMSSGAVPVRNATRRLSEERGELRHWQLDDDYSGFNRTDKKMAKNKKITDGRLFEYELNKLATFAYETSLVNVGFCQAAEAYPKSAKSISKRVFAAHNLPSEEKLFIRWQGRMNDDLINAMRVYQLGKMELSFKFISLETSRTQADAGGNTDIYELSGTARKSAYAVLMEPSAARLIIKFGRYHHSVDWKKISPKLIEEKYAKI